MAKTGPIDTKPLSLAEDFPAADRDAWLKLVEQSLKGVPFDKRLVSRTYDGIAIQPLYGRGDWKADGDPSGLPGSAPFTRGSTVLGATRNGWDVRQMQAHPDPDVANRQILEDLERGVTSIVLRVDASGEHGMMIRSLADLDTALRNVKLDLAPVVLEPSGPSLPQAALLMALAEKRGVASDALPVNFGADPLGTLATTGKLIVDLDTAMARAADLASYVAHTYSAARAINVKSLVYHSAGASDAQELGCALATAVEYLRAVTKTGLPVETACGQIALTLAADADVFMTVAKFRAARMLWSRVAEACGVNAEQRTVPISACTAPRMFTQRDPWTNILRATAACFAAGIAGADAVTVLPFEAALGLPKDLGRRVARNIQAILQEESGLNRVLDPAGGAWLFETLTDSLAETAWTFFQAIEKAGGMAKVLKGGGIAKALEKVQTERAKNIAQRRDAIIGVSEFPDVNEKPVEVDKPSLQTISRRIANTQPVGVMPPPPAAGTGELMTALAKAARGGANIVAMSKVLAGRPFTITPLPQMRLAETFEHLRDAADAWKGIHGHRPKIFLANVGTPAEFNARAAFAKNFFEAGGLEAVAGAGGLDIKAIAAAFKESGAKLAAVCTSETADASLAANTARALKSAGALGVYLAAKPGEHQKTLQLSGVDQFIHLGCDARVLLEDAHSRIGIKSLREAS